MKKFFYRFGSSIAFLLLAGAMFYKHNPNWFWCLPLAVLVYKTDREV